MGKRDDYVKQLQPLISDITRLNELEIFMITNSNLPGRRANLELSYAFADCFQSINISDIHWHLLNKWISISVLEAPVDDPKEFLPFSAIQALGSLHTLSDTIQKENITNTIKNSANDTRWRIREAVAMAFQRIAENNFAIINEIFSDWINNSSLLEKRAIIATLAHPPILNDDNNVLFCLDITEKILTHIIVLDTNIRKTEEYKALKKGLEYTISVFVEKLPEQGFDLLLNWAQNDNIHIKKIIKQNIGKSRLKKKYSNEINKVLSVL